MTPNSLLVMSVMRTILLSTLLCSVAAQHFLLETESGGRSDSDYNGLELMKDWLHGDGNGRRSFKSFDESDPSLDSQETVEIDMF